MTSSKEPQIETEDPPRRLWSFRRRPHATREQPAGEPFDSFVRHLGPARIQTADVPPRRWSLRPLRRRRDRARPDHWSAAPLGFGSPPDAHAAPPFEAEDVVARSLYGKLLVWCYILFVGAVLIGPFGSWALISQTHSAAQFMNGLRNVQDFALAMLGGLSVLAGFVGLIIGRYFSKHDI